MRLDLKGSSLAATAFSCALLAIALAGANEARKELAPLAAKQRAVTEHARRWQATYQQLAPVEALWRQAFRDASAAKDLLSVYRALDVESAGLVSSADYMQVEKIDRAKADGIEIGAVEIHVATAGKPGLSVTAGSFGGLLKGIRRLSSRPDIRLSGVLVSAEGERRAPVATLVGLRLVVRDAEP